MYKLYSNKSDFIFIEITSLKKYIEKYVEDSSYDFKIDKVEIYLRKYDMNEIIVFIKKELNIEILNRLEFLRREIIFFLNSEMEINDFYVNLFLR